MITIFILANIKRIYHFHELNHYIVETEFHLRKNNKDSYRRYEDDIGPIIMTKGENAVFFADAIHDIKEAIFNYED